MSDPACRSDLLPSQPDLLDQVPAERATPSQDTIRQRLQALLVTARSAERMPWDASRARVNALLFHNMANWLPQPERDALRTAFAQEIARLRSAE